MVVCAAGRDLDVVRAIVLPIAVYVVWNLAW
jgi:hypothetical protein